MTDSWTQAVRTRLGLGRVLPLGGAADGLWVTEQAAVAVLRAAGAGVPGVVTGALRVTLDDPDSAVPPEVAMVPSALPGGPLRIEAEAEVLAGEVLPVAVGHLRDAMFAAAGRVGLEVVAVDVRVSGLVESLPEPDAPARLPEAATASGPVAVAAAAVPGIAHFTGVLGAPVRTAADHVRIEIAVAAGHRAVDAARAVQAAVGGELPVGVLVTAVDVP
jgi:hypothetical protein